MAQVSVSGAAGWHLRVVERLLSYGAGEAHGQLAGGIYVAEENVLDGGTGLDTRAPRLKDCRDVLVGPLQFEGTRRENDKHHRLSGCDDGFEKVLLLSGESEGGTAGGFALHPVGWLAEREDCDVGFARSGDRFGDGLLIVQDGFCGTGSCAGEGDALEFCGILCGEQAASPG